MSWASLGKAIYWTLGAVQSVGEAIVAGRRMVKKARQGTLRFDPDETDPAQPTWRDVARQQEQIKAATTHKVKR